LKKYHKCGIFMLMTGIQAVPEGPFIFLGGTCGSHDWRDSFRRHLFHDALMQLVNPEVVTFDPRAPSWTDEVVAIEEEAKRRATGLVFYLGHPNDDISPASMYSGAEAAVYSLKRPHDTAIVLEPQISNIPTHGDKQRRNVAKLIADHAPEANILEFT
jgi:hypothetical protein